MFFISVDDRNGSRGRSSQDLRMRPRGDARQGKLRLAPFGSRRRPVSLRSPDEK